MKYGFLGFGNLSHSVVNGWLNASVISKNDITTLVKSEISRSKNLAEGYAVSADIADLLSSCDILVLAVKPAVFEEMAELISSCHHSLAGVVSFMAGTGLDRLREIFYVPVMRIIPTIASENGNDIIAAAGDVIPTVLADFEKLGNVIVTDEQRLIHIMVAASCGLGFASRLLLAYERAVKELGLSQEDAHLIASRTFSNAAAFEDYDRLISMVATKGGLTEKGVNLLTDNNIDGLLADTLRVAIKK